jgi:hypothetical protein
MQTNKFRNDSELCTGTPPPLHEFLTMHMNKHYSAPHLYGTGFTETTIPPVVFRAMKQSRLRIRCPTVTPYVAALGDQYYPLGYVCPCSTEYIGHK